MKKYLKFAMFLVLAVVLVSPFSASAKTKAGAKPGNFFYFFDKAFEKADLFFTFSPEKKAKKALENAEERLAEAEESASENDQKAVETAMEDYQENIEILEEVLAKVPEKTKQAIQKAIEASRKGREKAEEEDSEIKQGLKEVKGKSKKIIYHIDNSKVLVTGKRTHNYTGPDLSSDLSQVITLSAILKNNAEIGIPSVKINKVTIFDDKNKIVAIKQNYNKDISIPYQGEFPFSFVLWLKKTEAPEVIKANNFDIEFEIPPFSVNEKAVRLDILNQKIKSIEKSEPDHDGNISYLFTYNVLLSNNSDKEVSNIRRISFLKSKGETLTKIGDACCYPVSFEIKSNDKVLSLDAKKYIEILKPYEQREYEFEISPSLYNKAINTNNVELVNYFIGSTRTLIIQERNAH